MDTEDPTHDEGCMGPTIPDLTFVLGVTGMLQEALTRSGNLVLAIKFIAQLLSETANARDKE